MDVERVRELRDSGMGASAIAKGIGKIMYIFQVILLMSFPFMNSGHHQWQKLLAILSGSK